MTNNPNQAVKMRAGTLWNLLRVAMQVGSANPELQYAEQATVKPVIDIYTMGLDTKSIEILEGEYMTIPEAVCKVNEEH